MLNKIQTAHTKQQARQPKPHNNKPDRPNQTNENHSIILKCAAPDHPTIQTAHSQQMILEFFEQLF